jgi:hypothetical protein
VGTLSALAPLFIAIELRAISKFEKVRNSVYTKIEFPKVKYELYFDMEDDPKQEFVYMHGKSTKISRAPRSASRRKSRPGSNFGISFARYPKTVDVLEKSQ